MTADTEPSPPMEPMLLHPKRAVELAKFLYVQRVSGFRIAEAPEFEPQCTPFFVERLKQAASYLEFGSGGSTVLAAKLGIPFVAVESDRFFLDAVSEKVRSVGAFDETKQTYIYSNIGLTGAWGKPVLRRPSADRLERWRRYPRAPWEAFAPLPGPHLILVDGRFRVACALLAAKFLRGRSGDILFDDYAGRPYYHVVEQFLNLRESVGRMALFTAREEVDVIELDRQIDRYCRDWR